jgi:hypothetical protein
MHLFLASEEFSRVDCLRFSEEAGIIREVDVDQAFRSVLQFLCFFVVVQHELEGVNASLVFQVVACRFAEIVSIVFQSFVAEDIVDLLFYAQNLLNVVFQFSILPNIRLLGLQLEVPQGF